MKGVFLHILADTLGSVGVIISAFLMSQFGWMVADPVCSMFIATMIMMSVYPLLRDSISVLMQRQPRELDEDLSRSYRKVLFCRTFTCFTGLLIHFFIVDIGNGNRRRSQHSGAALLDVMLEFLQRFGQGGDQSQSGSAICDEPCPQYFQSNRHQECRCANRICSDVILLQNALSFPLFIPSLRHMPIQTHALLSSLGCSLLIFYNFYPFGFIQSSYFHF